MIKLKKYLTIALSAVMATVALTGCSSSSDDAAKGDEKGSVYYLSFKPEQEVYKEIMRKDWFMGLLDFQSYCDKKEEAFKEYENRKKWSKRMLINISKAGYFSSDRTIGEYNNDIWKLK